MSNKEELEIAEDQLRMYKSLDSLKDTEGGKAILSFYKNEIDVQVNWLVYHYKDGDETEIRARCAKIEASKANIDMVINAEENARVTQEQIKSLKE